MGSRRLLVTTTATLALAAFVWAQDGVTRPAKAPGLRAGLVWTHAEVRGGFVLTDVTGLVKTLEEGPAPAEELVTRVVVTLDAQGTGTSSAVVKDAPWRGLLLPKEVDDPRSPREPYDEVRIKVLLMDREGRAVRSASGSGGARVVLKIGDTVYPSFDALSAAVKAFDPDAPMILDAWPGVPSRHAISVLALLLDAGRAPTIATPEAEDGPGPDMTQVGGALSLAARIAPKGPDGLPVVGVRVRADARCTWRAVQAVLHQAVGAQIRRITFAANSGDREIDLFPAGRRGRVGGIRREAPAAAKKQPIVILEDEVEVPRQARKPKTVRAPSAPGAEAGDSNTEHAVSRALAWLRRHQAADGHWTSDATFNERCRVGQDCGVAASPWKTAPGDHRYAVGVTSLAVLAYLGAGNTHRFGAYKRTVRGALTWLAARQKPDGTLGFERSETIYNHALATWALCEAYAVSRDFTLKKPCEKAVQFILEAQNQGLGWKYGVRSGRNDTAVTSFMLLALHAARVAGISVPETAFLGGQLWLQRVTASDGDVGYETPGGGSAFFPQNDGKFDVIPAMTGLSAYVRLVTAKKRFNARQATKILSASPPTWDAKGRLVNFYYWHFGTLAMHQIGGEPWRRWNAALKAALVPKQHTQGCANGSWDPAGEWCLAGGRVYATAINALTMETYYRYPRRW